MMDHVPNLAIKEAGEVLEDAQGKRKRINAFIIAGVRLPPQSTERENRFETGNAQPAIRQWFPEAETVEACKARLERIVAKQRQCYSRSMALILLIRQEIRQRKFRRGSTMSSYIE